MTDSDQPSRRFDAATVGRRPLSRRTMVKSAGIALAVPATIRTTSGQGHAAPTSVGYGEGGYGEAGYGGVEESSLPNHLVFADQDDDDTISRREVGQAIAAFNTGQDIDGHDPSRREVGQLIAYYNQNV